MLFPYGNIATKDRVSQFSSSEVYNFQMTMF